LVAAPAGEPEEPNPFAAGVDVVFQLLPLSAAPMPPALVVVGLAPKAFEAVTPAPGLAPKAVVPDPHADFVWPAAAGVLNVAAPGAVGFEPKPDLPRAPSAPPRAPSPPPLGSGLLGGCGLAGTVPVCSDLATGWPAPSFGAAATPTAGVLGAVFAPGGELKLDPGGVCLAKLTFAVEGGV